MIEELHIENFALIDKTTVSFGEGFNVLTGETGAGKSILLGALSLSLGAKADKEALRDPSKDCFVEAVFKVSDEETAALKTLDIEAYDGEVILSRRIGKERSAAKINGESVPAPRLKAAGEVLIDIYGQKEHQSLLKKANHLALIDAYGGKEIAALKEENGSAYGVYRDLKKQWEEADIDASEQARQTDMLTHDIEVIEDAALRPGEDEELEEKFRLLSHAEKIREAASEALENTDGEEGASETIERALRALAPVTSFDEKLNDCLSTLSDAGDLISDFNRTLHAYIDGGEFSEETYRETADRLDLINTLKSRYGRTIEDILKSLEEKKKRLEELSDHEAHMASLKASLAAAEKKLSDAGDRLSEARRESALAFSKAVREELSDLAFLDVKFETRFSRTKDYTANGVDEAEFYIALNPGEPMRALADIASGGELSRIQLAIKSVGAMESSAGCYVFDEIDTGISGRTAQAVAEKLSKIATKTQVISITHLQAIAAMADRHLLIEKAVSDGRTLSTVRTLSEDEAVEELGRMIGGADLTETVLSDAREMRERAKAVKEKLRG